MPISTLPDPPELRCELTEHVNGGTVSVSGLIFSSVARSGTYQLRVIKNGPSGRSVLKQGGAFTTKPPEASAVGHMAFSVEAGANFKVYLRVTSDDRNAECEDGHERL